MLREVDIDRDVRPRNRTRKVKLPHIESARRAQ